MLNKSLQTTRTCRASELTVRKKYMFSRRLNDRTHLSLTVPQFAEEIFALTNKDRSYLREWLPWLDSTNEVKDTRDFLTSQLKLFAESKALHTTIFYNEKIAGVLAFNVIDEQNKSGHIGYWLGSEFQGKGIMTEAVRELMNVGVEFYDLERFEIRCAVQNEKSRAIPERLGFTNEGTIRRAEKVYDNWWDHIVYGKLAKEINHANQSVVTTPDAARPTS